MYDYGPIAVISPETERGGTYEEIRSIDDSRKTAGRQKGGSPVAPENSGLPCRCRLSQRSNHRPRREVRNDAQWH